MEYDEFLRERRRRMADIVRVAFRQLGGEPNAAPLTPPWFLPGAEDLWKRSRRLSARCAELSETSTLLDLGRRPREESWTLCQRTIASG